jgi:hypothetical protein
MIRARTDRSMGVAIIEGPVGRIDPGRAFDVETDLDGEEMHR